MHFRTGILTLAACLLLAVPAAAGPRGIPFAPGNTLAGAISAGEAGDTFLFDGHAGDLFTASASGDKADGLFPALALVGPDGAEIDVARYLKASGSKAAMKNVPLTATGRHALVVSGGSGTSGRYVVKTKVKAAKPAAVTGTLVGPWARNLIEIPGTGGTVVKLALATVQGPTPAILDLLDPEWDPMGGAWANGLVSSGTGIKGSFTLAGPSGVYRLRIANDSGENLTLNLKLSLKRPKTAKATVTATDPEPRVTSLSAATAEPGDELSIYGTGFAAGCRVWFGDTESGNVTRMSDTEVKAEVPDGQGLLPVGVQNPDGQENPLPAALLVVGVAEVHPLFPPVNSLTDAHEIHVSGVSRFVASLSVNGVPATFDADGRTWEAVVPLAAGDNDLTLGGTDVEGQPFALIGSFATVVRTGAIPVNPESIVADLPNHRAFVADGLGHAILAVDLATGWGTVVSSPGIGTGVEDFEPVRVAWDAAGGRVLCTDTRYGLLAVDVATGNRAVLSGGTTGSGPQWSWPAGVAVNAGGTTAWVAAANGGQIFAVDLATGARTILSSDTVGSGPEIAGPEGMVLDAPGTGLLVLSPGLKTIWSVDILTGDRAIVSSNAVGTGTLWSRPVELALDGAGNRLFVADQNGPALWSVDLATGNRTLVSKTGTGTGPDFIRPTGVAFDPTSGRAFVTDWTGDCVFSVDIATGDRTAFSAAFVGDGHHIISAGKVAFDRTGETIYASETSGWAVYKVAVASGDRTLLADQTHGSGGWMEPSSLLFDGDLGAWLLMGSSYKLHGVDVVTGNRTEISGSERGSGTIIPYPNGLCRDSVAGAVLATTSHEDGVFSIDLATGDRTVVSSDDTGTGPGYYSPCSIIPSPLGDARFLLTDTDNHTICSMDRATGDRYVLAGWGAGSGETIESPRGLCAVGTDVIVADGGSGSLLRVDPRTGDRTVLSGPGVGQGPVTANPQDVIPWPSDHGVHAVLTVDSSRGALIAVHTRSGDRVIVSK